MPAQFKTPPPLAQTSVENGRPNPDRDTLEHAVDHTVERESLRSSRTADIFLTGACLLVLYAVFRGPVILWTEKGYGLVPAGSRLLMLACVALAASAFLAKRGAAWPQVHLLTVATSLVVVLFSDWMTYPYNFFQAPGIRGELLLTALLFPLIFLRLGAQSLRLLPVLASATLAVSFWSEAAGRVIFSDDHAAVFYRLTLLRENFPWIPFYNPIWNAGTDARDFFSTGILNLFLLLFPLFKFFPVEQVYNLAVGTVLFVFVPGVTYIAARRERLDGLGASIAATLALSTGLVAYRWGLKYGSMGFVTSYSLLPLAVSFVRTAGDPDEQFSAREALAAVLLIGVMCLWTPTTLVIIPAVLLALCLGRRLFQKKYVVKMIVTSVLFALPWVAIWLDAANVLAIISHSKTSSSANAPQSQASAVDESHNESDDGPSRAALDDAEDDSKATQSGREAGSSLARRLKGKNHELSRAGASRTIRNFAMNTNPLLLFFGPMGIALLPRRSTRWTLALTSAWLLTLGVAIAPLKPQLELERMLVIWSLLLALPAGAAMSRLFASVSGPTIPAGDATKWRMPRAILASIPAAFLIVGVFCSAAILRNRTVETYAFTDQTVVDLAAAIRTYGGDGRVVFSGFVLHELDRGHLAPLAYYTGHPLVASSPVHNTWWYTDVVPETFRDAGEPGVEQYFDLMNATAVVAHERFWRDYFNARPGTYQRVWSGSRFVMFKRKPSAPGYFYSGAGEILEQGSNLLRVRIDSPEATLKFISYPFLESSSCALATTEIRGVVQLIKLTGCKTGEVVTIRAKTGLRRTVQSWFGSSQTGDTARVSTEGGE